MRVVVRFIAFVLVPALGLAACHTPRLGKMGDTCGRTDDCEAPLRCLGAVCRDGLAGAEGVLLPRTAGGARPPDKRPATESAPAEPTPVPADAPPPAAGNGGLRPTRPPDEAAVPAAGVPGVH